MLTKTEFLLTLRKEICKEHIEFDIQGRISKAYIAPVYAVDGTPVLVIEYIYYGITSFVRGRREGYDEWQSIWDVIDLDHLVDENMNQLVDDMGNDLGESA